MAIYLEFDGIQGTVKDPDRSQLPYDPAFTGGVRVAMSGVGGVWKTTNFGDSGLAIAKIRVLDLPAGQDSIDSRDANAANRAKVIIGSRKGGGTFTLTFNGETTGRALDLAKVNKLKQIAASGRRIPRMELIFTDLQNRSVLRYRLENVSFNGVSAGRGVSRHEHFTLNYSKIERAL